MKQAIIIFTRVPIPGQTKTRLMPDLSPDECAQIHSCFIRDTLDACKNTKADIFVYFTPKEEEGKLIALVGDAFPYFSQEGEDLGRRMEIACEEVLARGYEKVVLIGTDIPQISTAVFEEAVRALDQREMVINPTEDGGYYLIGMKKNHPEAWRVKKYGCSTVVEETVTQLEAAGITVKMGKMLCDVDTFSDLKKLYQEQKKNGGVNIPNTWEYMKHNLSSKFEW